MPVLDTTMDTTMDTIMDTIMDTTMATTTTTADSTTTRQPPLTHLTLHQKHDHGHRQATIHPPPISPSARITTTVTIKPPSSPV